MPPVGQPERITQNRVVALFRDELQYKYLGNWEYRDGNSNIEEKYLSEYLNRKLVEAFYLFLFFEACLLVDNFK